MSELKSWQLVEFGDEEWTNQELRKAVQVMAAMAYWMGDNDAGTPMPVWCYLTTPFRKDYILECWDQWKAECDEQLKDA